MADHNKLYDACKTGDLEKVKYLVSNGCNPKADNNLCILYASENGHLELVKYLFSAGCDPMTDNNLCILYASVFGSGQISF